MAACPILMNYIACVLNCAHLKGDRPRFFEANEKRDVLLFRLFDIARAAKTDINDSHVTGLGCHVIRFHPGSAVPP